LRQSQRQSWALKRSFSVSVYHKKKIRVNGEKLKNIGDSTRLIDPEGKLPIG
jgi:hypothetical protein